MRSEHKPVLPRLSSSLRWGGSGAWLCARCCCLAWGRGQRRGRGCWGSRAVGAILQAPVRPGASPGRGVAAVEMAIMPNLLLIKNTLSQLPGRDALTVGEGSPVLSLAKPALQSDEGSKKTASGALRNAFFGRRVLGKAGLGHDPCQVSWRALCPGLAGARGSQNAPVKQVGACFAGDVAPTVHPAAPEGGERWSQEGLSAGVKGAGRATPQCPRWAIIPPPTPPWAPFLPNLGSAWLRPPGLW